DSSVDAVISKSTKGIIQTWNRSAERMFGYTPNEAIGKHISLIIPTELMNEEKMIIEKVLNKEHVEHYETMRMAKDKKLINVSISVSPIIDKAGTVVGAAKILRDITSRKTAEAELILRAERTDIRVN